MVGKAKLRWAERSACRTGGNKVSRQVSWLELLVDFELTTGMACQRELEESKAKWSERAKLLRIIVNAMLKVKGIDWKTIQKGFGDGRAMSSLAVFGAYRLPGLD